MLIFTEPETKCKADGCDNPRYRTATKFYPYCQFHQQEIFRRNADKYRPANYPPRQPRQQRADRTRCITPGCREPRWNGYTHCQEHQRALNHAAHLRYKSQRSDQTPSPFTAAEAQPAAEPKIYRIIVADWREDTLVELTATVVSINPMPETDGELQKILQSIRANGVLVAEELS